MAVRPGATASAGRVHAALAPGLAFLALTAAILIVVFPRRRGDEPPPLSLKAVPAARPDALVVEGGIPVDPRGVSPDPVAEGDPPDPEVARIAALQVREAEQTGDEDRVRRVLGRWCLDERLPEERGREYQRRQDDLNRRIVFSSAPAAGFAFETVQRGDNYWKIGERLRKRRALLVAPGLLEEINHVPASRLQAGDRIKYPEEALSLLVDKSRFALYVLLGDVPVVRFPVGIGKDDQTPEGRFVIGGKMARPAWTDPRTGRTYRHGEPGHLIGSRWLAFFDGNLKTGFGIHGTSDPESIGRALSEGCVRLRNEDVERLYELVPDGVPVVVQP